MPFILPASKAYLALGLAGFRSAQDNPIIEKGPGPCAYKKPNRVGIYEIPRNWKSRFSRNGKEEIFRAPRSQMGSSVRWEHTAQLCNQGTG